MFHGCSVLLDAGGSFFLKGSLKRCPYFADFPYDDLMIIKEHHYKNKLMAVQW